jgi:hypothetical protein
MTDGRTLADDGSGTPPDIEPRDATPEEDRPPTDADYGVAFSPRQVAGGFAILAALLVILARRRRRKKG